MESFEQICIERDGIEEHRSVLLSAAKALVAFQENYHNNMREDAPGNSYYAGLLMEVVKQARAAILLAEGRK